MATAADLGWMARARCLARRGLGTTAPNPIVGAVVVADGDVVVGQGAHRVAGGPHAEVIALESAGARARGATLYCTLEPCSHTGRTGPCAVRVADAGIARVVIAVTDPNPKVSGQGIAYLRARGLEVVTGVDDAAAARENAPFLTWITRGRPLVTSKVAVSADGFVGRTGGRVRLTGAASDRRTHRERGAVEALLVGTGTVLADDPELTPRLAYRARPLWRVVLDRRGRTPATAKVLGTRAHGPVAIVTTPETAAGPVAHDWARAGADVIVVDAPDDGAWLRGVLDALAARDVLHVVVEGGPTVHGAFWAHGLVDRVRVIETPHMLGDGVPVFRPAAPSHARMRMIGPDRWVEWDVHGTD